MSYNNRDEYQLKLTELSTLTSRIRTTELELRVASASGNLDLFARLERDLAGLRVVRDEVQSQVDTISTELHAEEASEKAVLESQISEIEKRKKEHNKNAMLFGATGMTITVFCLFLFMQPETPDFATEFSVLGFFVGVIGAYQWDKAKELQALIPFMKAGISEEDARRTLAEIKQRVKNELNKEE